MTFRTFTAAALAALLALPTAAAATPFTPVTDESQFRQLVQDRDLKYGLFGVTLRVLQNGAISGNAVGSEVSGSWVWRDGYFCRSLNWGGDDLGYNCQLVEVSPQAQLRFTVDQGRGESATFRLQ